MSDDPGLLIAAIVLTLTVLALLALLEKKWTRNKP
jgi:hypothetical protein